MWVKDSSPARKSLADRECKRVSHAIPFRRRPGSRTATGHDPQRTPPCRANGLDRSSDASMVAPLSEARLSPAYPGSTVRADRASRASCITSATSRAGRNGLKINSSSMRSIFARAMSRLVIGCLRFGQIGDHTPARGPHVTIGIYVRNPFRSCSGRDNRNGHDGKAPLIHPRDSRHHLRAPLNWGEPSGYLPRRWNARKDHCSKVVG